MSVDSIYALRSWASALGGIRHPLLADFWPHGEVARLFGIFNDENGITNRAVIIIDPQGVIRHGQVYQGTLPDVDDVVGTLATLKNLSTEAPKHRSTE